MSNRMNCNINRLDIATCYSPVNLSKSLEVSAIEVILVVCVSLKSPPPHSLKSQENQIQDRFQSVTHFWTVGIDTSYFTILICSGITRGRVLSGELYVHRFQISHIYRTVS